MIVKFDHISYSCAFSEEEQVKASLSGYEEVFAEKALQNLPIKAEFLKVQSETHNITMLQHPETIPIEITSYETCAEAPERLSLTAEGIRVRTADVAETKAFYERLGFRGEGDGLSIKPMLDQSPLNLFLEEAPGAEKETWLDAQGFGILAFVVDNGAKQKKQLEGSGFYTTEIQELTVNGKVLKIFFAKSGAGDLVELIGIR